MNWNEILKKYAVDTLEFIKSGKDVAVSQGQLYLQELIKWEIAHGVFWVLISLVVIFIIVLHIKPLAKKEKLEESDLIQIFVGSFISAVMLIVLTVNANSALKAYIAPRVVIIEKLQRMVK